jgi:hypothetical protein
MRLVKDLCRGDERATGRSMGEMGGPDSKAGFGDHLTLHFLRGVNIWKRARRFGKKSKNCSSHNAEGVA